MSRIKKAVELDQVDEINTVSIRSDATFPNRVRKNEPQKNIKTIFVLSIFERFWWLKHKLQVFVEYFWILCLCGVVWFNTVVLMLHNLNFLSKRSIFTISLIELLTWIVHTVLFWSKMHLDYPLVYMFHQNNQCEHKSK